ncbi:MAG: nuclear transport factor 2 family protein [Bacteroidota bacterium]
MDLKKSIITSALVTFYFAAPASTVNELGNAKKIAEKFVQLVDNNEADKLKNLLHPEMLQYVTLDGKLIPFKAADFIQMVADKKIGGTPRKITHKNSDIIRGDAAYIVLQAVSHEYDFMYHLSMAKNDGKWIIVGIVADIVKV